VEETGELGENHRPVASHWQTWSHNIASSTPRLSGFQTHNVSGCIHIFSTCHRKFHMNWTCLRRPFISLSQRWSLNSDLTVFRKEKTGPRLCVSMTIAICNAINQKYRVKFISLLEQLTLREHLSSTPMLCWILCCFSIFVNDFSLSLIFNKTVFN
jgi:hypothetical protein